MPQTAAADPQLAFIFRRPFDEQVAFFRGKLGNLVPTERWDDIWKSAHDRAFMVAGAAKADLLADLAGAVDQAIAGGETFEAFKKRFEDIVKKHGWTGWTGEETEAGRAWRARIIYQTNLSTSYAAGRLAQLKDAGFKYWVYRHTPNEHPRLQHLAWDGMTLPADHPFWQTHYPPSGWNCFPGDTMVRCDASLGHRMFYRGEVVEFQTRGGNRLTLTVNHPVLTRRGWVAAGQLQAGDEVLTAALDGDAALHGVVDDPQPPARAEDLFEALAAQGFRIIPVAAHDFHGDALGSEGEVHIAGSDRMLMDVVEAELGERAGELRFDEALAGGVESADDAMRAAQQTPVADDPVFAQDASNRRFGETQAPGDGRLARQPFTIQRKNLALGVQIAVVGDLPGALHQSLAPIFRLPLADPSRLHPVGAVSGSDASGDEQSAQWGAADAALFGDLLEADAGKVARDEIVRVRKFQWSDHVYDFTTATGFIVAGGVIVSNCKCRVVGADGTESAKLLGGKPGYTEPPAGWDAIDPKTGEPVGIDKGWGYMPGGTVADDVARAVARKTVAWPYEAAKAYMADVPMHLRDALALAIRSQPETFEAARRYAERALGMRGGQPIEGAHVEPYQTLGLLTSAETETVSDLTGADAVRSELYDWTIGQYAPKHILKEHGDAPAEAARGQRAPTAEDYARIPEIISAPERIWTDDGETVLMEKWFTAADGSEERVVLVWNVLKKRRMLTLTSMRIYRRSPRAQRP
jgi:hypothetical protein